MNFPEYRKINEDIEVAILIYDFSQINSALSEINKIEVAKKLRSNALKARDKYNWQSEKEVLIKFYTRLASSK
jgi:glycosyltransferase involved in cell wall biosynthesis